MVNTYKITIFKPYSQTSGGFKTWWCCVF